MRTYVYGMPWISILDYLPNRWREDGVLFTDGNYVWPQGISINKCSWRSSQICLLFSCSCFAWMPQYLFFPSLWVFFLLFLLRVAISISFQFVFFLVYYFFIDPRVQVCSISVFASLCVIAIKYEWRERKNISVTAGRTNNVETVLEWSTCQFSGPFAYGIIQSCI